MRRLFVSDLDGTLLNRDAKLSEETLRILNDGMKRGLNFTVSTARTPTTALKIVQDLQLHLPVMLMNGVLVYDVVSGRCLKKEVMDSEVVMTLLGLVKTKGLECFLYGMEQNEFVAYYDGVSSTSLNYFRNERIMKYNKQFTEVEDLSLVAGKDIIYCMLREPKEKLEGLYRELSVVKGVKAEFYQDIYSDDYYMLEIYSENASKQRAVEYLKQAGKFDMVIGFGDNLNDKALAQASDCFFAVSNAHKDIKALADSVIPSNDEDGVARFIEEMMKAGERS